jgi:hypothetical protein
MRYQMRTQYVSDTPLDDTRLAQDLELSNSLPWSEAHSEYVSGGAYKSCMLWTLGGDAGDGVVTKYDHHDPGAFTSNGNQLPYLRELISSVVDLDRLNFVRLAKVRNNVIIPHRDLLELGDLPDDTRNAHRVHIPLVTNDNCFFNEGNTVYRMRKGEIWFLDAAVIHSVAVLSPEDRIHLMLDFVNTEPEKPLITVEHRNTEVGIPVDHTVTRPPLTDADRAGLLRLGDVITMDSVDEIFSIVIKKHYRFDGGEDFVWNTMHDIARAASDPAVLRHIDSLRRYFTIERSAAA